MGETHGIYVLHLNPELGSIDDSFVHDTSKSILRCYYHSLMPPIRHHTR